MNKYGLKRRPSNAVAREIRRRCGFGCVICGDAIFTYEHFNPPYKDAKEHNPNGMTLLCGSHQLETSKGFLSKESIAEANRDPICKRKGYAEHLFDLGGGKRPSLFLGGINATHCGRLLAFNDKPFLTVLPPERHSHRWQMSCRFTDKTGLQVCEIVKNELLLNTESFDIRQHGCTFSVHAYREKILELELQASLGLVIKKYCMQVGGGRVVIEEQNLSAIDPRLRMGTIIRFELPNGNSQTFVNCAVTTDEGLNIKLLDGALQFVPLPAVGHRQRA